MKNQRFHFVLYGLVFFSCVSIIVAAGMGYISISARDILSIIWATCIGNSELLQGIDPSYSYVIMDIRLPRILSSFLVGAILSMSGVIYQGILRNPLADPYTLGVSSGAAFGAALALFANMIFLPLSLPLCAFLGAFCTLLLVLRLSSFQGQISANSLILSGVIVGAILSAGISFIKYLADEQVSAIIFWLMGSFVARTWLDVLSLSLALFILGMISLYYARDLNIIATGERAASSLGVETNKVRYILLIVASFATALCVSSAGIIGFVGLIVPHLVRLVLGSDNRVLIPISLFVGGILLLLADTTSRAFLPVEIPIGIITALLGGPIFCVIFRQRQRRVFYD